MSTKKPVFILTAPSTAGKNHVLRSLKATGQFDELVTMTTRRPRTGEQDGVDYHFSSHERFEELIAQDGMIEYVKVPGKDSEKGYNYYGTPKTSLADVFEQGKTPVVILEPEGAVDLFNYLNQHDYLPACIYLNAQFNVGLSRFADRISEDLNGVTGNREEEMKIAKLYAQRIEAFDKEISWFNVTDFDVVIGPSITDKDLTTIKDFFMDAKVAAESEQAFPWPQARNPKPMNRQFLVRESDQSVITHLSNTILKFHDSGLKDTHVLSKAIRNELECSKLLEK